MGEAKDAKDEKERQGEGSTLGDVLCAGRAEPRVSETQWAALVQSIAAGDLPSLHALYQRTHRIVFTLIMRIIGNRETAEELTLDVFHDVWRRASTYDPANGTVVGWVMNQARSRAIDRLRFDQRRKRVNRHADDPITAASATIGPYETLALQEQSRRLREALTRLTSRERQAIEIAFFSELTYAEVATRLGEPVGTVKTRIRSGLQKLRQALTSEHES